MCSDTDIGYTSVVSGIKGKRLLFFGAIHGNETGGTFGIQRMLSDIAQDKITLTKGMVTFVPKCNPRAWGKCRFVDVNLNNIFNPKLSGEHYEHHLVPQLCGLIDQHDVLVDLHSFASQGPSFGFQDYDDEDTRALTSATGVSPVITGWFDLQREPGRAEPVDYAHGRGKTATVVECGMNSDPRCADIAYMVILNVLAHLGMIDRDVPHTQAPCYIRVKKVFTRPEKCNMVRKWGNLERVTANTVIAEYESGETFFTAPCDGYILLPFPDIPAGIDWFFWAEDEP